MKRTEAWSVVSADLNEYMNGSKSEGLSDFEFQITVSGYYNFLQGLLMGGFDLTKEEASDEFMNFLINSEFNPFEIGLDKCRSMYEWSVRFSTP